MSEKTTDNAAHTREFFNRWTDYRRLVDNLDTYRNLDLSLKGCLESPLLDIGNGGVFNYAIDELNSVVVIDIAEQSLMGDKSRTNVAKICGDARMLPLREGSFQTVLVQMLIHHLADSTIQEMEDNTARLLKEIHRVLKPGGKLVILETFLPPLVEQGIRRFYPLFKGFLRLINHPLVFQWSRLSFEAKLGECGFQNREFFKVPLGKWIILLGVPWPVILTPQQVYRVVATKS